ncbi:hypothetical protein ACH5RR_027483 [Cinchona calisaya]|uniref:Uncharacterized protein n=1 Tax=Cinchona calisaya TaxID=153742 RepID=A0ABD2Z7F4_9GENT
MKHKLRMGSDGEDGLSLGTSTSTARNRYYKFPKKFRKDGSSAVPHVSVPRKLRSAMKKRSRTAVSEKMNHVADGVELLRKDGSLKPKLKMKKSEARGCVTEGTQEPVTKDEEEVAEALFALAGVLSNTVKTDNTRSVGQGLGVNSSNMKKAESSVTPIHVEIAEGEVEEEPKTISYVDEAPNHWSNPVCSTGESVVLHCRNDPTQPNISVGKQASIASDDDIAEVNLHSTAFDSEKQHAIQKAICNSVVSGNWTELSKTRSKFSNLEKSPVTVKQPILAPIAVTCSQADVQQAIKETRNNGSSLRPDLSSAISCDSHGLEIPLQSSLANCSSQSPKLESSIVAKKDYQIAINSKNSWKRCTTHGYICRFIKVFQITERKNRSMMHSTALTTNEAQNQVARITVIDLTEERDDTIGVVCSSSCSGSTPEKNVTEVRNAILLHKRLIQDQQQAYTPYEIYTPQNQSLKFLSLSAGTSQLEASNGNNRAKNGLEILTQRCSPGLLSQKQPTIPFPMPQNCYASTSFCSHPSVAALHKMSPYVGGSPFGPTHMDAATASSQQQEQQQQKRALIMAHYKSRTVASPGIPNKHTEGPNLPPLFQNVQALYPPSLSSLELHGARCAPVLQQPSPTVKGQYHHIPSVYEAKKEGVRSENVPLRII